MQSLIKQILKEYTELIESDATESNEFFINWFKKQSEENEKKIDL